MENDKYGEELVQNLNFNVAQQKYRDIRTGEIVTEFDILDIKYMEEIDDSTEEK